MKQYCLKTSRVKDHYADEDARDDEAAQETSLAANDDCHRHGN